MMAQSFDMAKAANDLKQILNMDTNSSHTAGPTSSGSPAVSSKKRKKPKKSSGTPVEDTVRQSPVFGESPTPAARKGSAPSNKNGNASKTIDMSYENRGSQPQSDSKKDKSGNKSNMKKTQNQEKVLNSDMTNSQKGIENKAVNDVPAQVISPSETRKNKAYQHPSSASRAKESASESKFKDKNGRGTSSAGSFQRKGSGDDRNLNNNKPKQSRLGEEELLPQFLEELEQNKMHILKKRSLRFPNARFFCRLCDYHVDMVKDCEEHMKDSKHCRRKEISKIDGILRSMPEPTQKQLDAITQAVEKMYITNSISEEEQKVRADIVARLEADLQKTVPDASLHMYGSSLTGFGLKTADINVNLVSTDKDKKLTTLLKEVYCNLKDRTDIGFVDIHSDFSATVPALLLTDEATQFTVTMTIHCYFAQCTSELLAIYSDFDDRVKKLAVAFRYWANLCGLDRQDNGYIPPHALGLMVIYFLQKINPQLVPIIQPPKATGEEVGDFSKDAPAFQRIRQKVMKNKSLSKNKMTLGELWLQLLRFYSIDFDTTNTLVSIRSSAATPRTPRPRNSKRLAVEDPYLSKKNITRMFNNVRIDEYWQDSIRRAFHYFGLPRDDQGGSHISEADLKELVLLREKPETYDVKETGPDSQNGKKDENDKEMAERSPLQDKAPNQKLSNVLSAEVSSSQLSEPSKTQSASGLSPDKPPPVSMDQSKESETIPQSGLSSVMKTSESIASSDISQITDSMEQLEITSGHSSQLGLSSKSNGSHGTLDSFEELKAKSDGTSHSKDTVDQGPISLDSSTTKDNIKHDKVIDSSESSGFIGVERTSLEESSSTENKSKKDQVLAESEVQSCVKEKQEKKTLPKALLGLSEKDCVYTFNKDFLTGGVGPVLVCKYCDKEGHLKHSCDEELPEILPLPPLTKNHIRILSETLNQVPADVGLSEFSIRERYRFLDMLANFIKIQFDDSKLELFGSTCNGFGFDRSDMDICMTFTRRKGAIDIAATIESLARRLKQCSDLKQVEAITTAKVPIVKFVVKKTNLEGDISLYNTLAQQNTKLLHCYSQIDRRVQVLGYVIKTFAKVCDLGDASRGSLSSYAYVLMMIYYLQQVKPPVIPVLQELYEGPEKPKYIIDECDAWFMDDLSKLDKLWPERGQNKMSVAELWLGFLRFYVEEFNYREFVVCIRQKELLTRFEKLWNGVCIAIEDPFDLSHNLGSGLKKKMNNFIFKTFINGRMLYGSPVDDNKEMLNSYATYMDYFFDKDLLSENRPTNARGCRKCGRIGHLQRQCPTYRDRDEEKGLPPRQQNRNKPQHHSQQQLQQQQLQQQRGQSSQQRDREKLPQHPQQPQQQQGGQQSQQQLQQKQLLQQHQQQQQRKQQYPQQWEREKQERNRREKERRQQDSSDKNRNATIPGQSGLSFNLDPTSHPGLLPVTPAQLRGGPANQPSGYHNMQYRDQPHYPPQQQPPQQQQPPGGPHGHGYPPNLFYASTPRPGGQSNPNFGFNQSSPSPVFSQIYQRSGGSGGMRPPSNPNFHQRPPPPFVQYNGPVGHGGMNPVVQNLFASAQGQGQMQNVHTQMHNYRK